MVATTGFPGSPRAARARARPLYPDCAPLLPGEVSQLSRATVRGLSIRIALHCSRGGLGRFNCRNARGRGTRDFLRKQAVGDSGPTPGFSPRPDVRSAPAPGAVGSPDPVVRRAGRSPAPPAAWPRLSRWAGAAPWRRAAGPSGRLGSGAGASPGGWAPGGHWPKARRPGTPPCPPRPPLAGTSGQALGRQ